MLKQIGSDETLKFHSQFLVSVEEEADAEYICHGLNHISKPRGHRPRVEKTYDCLKKERKKRKARQDAYNLPTFYNLHYIHVSAPVLDRWWVLAAVFIVKTPEVEFTKSYLLYILIDSTEELDADMIFYVRTATVQLTY